MRKIDYEVYVDIGDKPIERWFRTLKEARAWLKIKGYDKNRGFPFEIVEIYKREKIQ